MYHEKEFCPRDATQRVTKVNPDGVQVTCLMCDECAGAWRVIVGISESRQDIPLMGIVHPKSTWTVEKLAGVM